MITLLENLAELFKSQWIPGSATFFVYGLILATLLIYSGRRSATWGRRLLLALAITGYLLSTPLVASSLVYLLSSGYEPMDPGQTRIDIGAIVILGGGGSTVHYGTDQLDMLSDQTSLRLLEGLRLYRKLSPAWLVVSGGTTDRAGVSAPESETMASSLIELGVSADHILIEGESGNTRDQAINLPPLLARYQVDHFVLVTSATHIRRADLSFRAEATGYLTSIAPSMSDTEPALGWSPLPNAEALDTSRDVFREVVGLLYYFLRGWI
jgi:uncharacterized SAM-binding protein YcdF (DUF218 family)